MDMEQVYAADLEGIMRAYLESFQSRDLQRSVGFFAEDGFINFQTRIFRGSKAIEQWHVDRFEAGLRIEGVDSIRVNGDTVIIDATVSSKQLSAWRIRSLSGRLTARLKKGKIHECEFSPRLKF